MGEGLGRDDVEIVLALVRGLEVWGTRARGGASAAYWEMGQVQTEAEGCKGVGLVLLCLLRALTRAIAARGVGGGGGVAGAVPGVEVGGRQINEHIREKGSCESADYHLRARVSESVSESVSGGGRRDGWGRWVGKGLLRKWVGKIWASVVLVLEEFEDRHHEAEALLREVNFCVG